VYRLRRVGYLNEDRTAVNVMCDHDLVLELTAARSRVAVQRNRRRIAYAVRKSDGVYEQTAKDVTLRGV
jgi:hypothetical protein